LEEEADMARKSDHVQLSLRIEPELHEKLKQSAEKHRTTVSAEIKWRIDRTFERDLAQRQEDLIQDMEITWHRYAIRFTEIAWQNEILSALVEDDFAKAKAFAGELLKVRARAALERSEKDSRDAAKIERWRAEQLTQK
jgi:hypothetical protein